MACIALKPEDAKRIRDEGSNKCHASQVRVI